VIKTFQSVLLPFSLSMILLIAGCSPASTPVLPEPSPARISPVTNPPQPASTPASTLPPEQISDPGQQTVPEVEKMAGFDVKEPTYLPAGVSFDFATYEASPNPNAVLHFKFVHEQYGDMGPLFQIMQAPQTVAPPDTVSCGEAVDNCEALQIGGTTVIYRLNAGGTEGLDWYADGFSFRLLRTAGEPDKIYKDELV
jgi:hypothetical protein